MAKFTQEQIDQALSTKAAHLGPDDVRRIAKNKQAVLTMIGEFPESWDKAKRQARLLFDIIEASAAGRFHAHPDQLKDATAALIYLGELLDIVPDDQEGGYADDAAVVGTAISRSAELVRKFCEKQGLNVGEYID